MPARLTALGLTVLLAAPALAHDEGRSVTFRRSESASFLIEPVQPEEAGPRVVYESGLSDALPDAWDTVLVQGVLPDPAVSFEVLRPGANAAQDSSSWAALETHRFEGGRFWAKARLPRKSAGPLMLRALDTGARGRARVEVYGVEVFAAEPQAPGAPAVPPRGPQNPAAPRPSVHERAEWGATRPTLPYVPDPMPWRVTLHHSDGKYTRTLAESEAEARFIQDFHIHGRGWIDIAYHFLIDSQGNILEGRPEGTLGAHTLSNNEGNVGVVLLGTYHPPTNDKPTPAQLAALVSLGRYLVARYGIEPNSLKGHRDYKSTDCPGDIVYTRLGELRLAFGGGVPPAVADALRVFSPPAPKLAGNLFDGARR